MLSADTENYLRDNTPKTFDIRISSTGMPSLLLFQAMRSLTYKVPKVLNVD